MALVTTPQELAIRLKHIGEFVKQAERVCKNLDDYVIRLRVQNTTPGDISTYANDILDTLSDGAGTGLAEEAIDNLEDLNFTHQEVVVPGSPPSFKSVDIHADANDETDSTYYRNRTAPYDSSGTQSGATMVIADKAASVHWTLYNLFKYSDIVTISNAEDAGNNGTYTVSATPSADAAETEYVSDGDMSSSSNWTEGTGWSIGSGTATKSAGTQSDLEQDAATLGTNLDEAYLLTFTYTRTAGTLSVIMGTNTIVTGLNAAGPTTLYFIVRGIGSSSLKFRGDSSFAGTVDDVSLTPFRGLCFFEALSTNNTDDESVKVTLEER